MAIIQCFECGQPVSDIAVSCPQCGEPKKSHPPAAKTNPMQVESKTLLWVIGSLAAVGGILFLLAWVGGGFTPEASAARAEKYRTKDAVKACWEEQARKSVTPATARFIAGACEKMESDYRAKYGAAP